MARVLVVADRACAPYGVAVAQDVVVLRPRLDGGTDRFEPTDELANDRPELKQVEEEFG